MTNADRPIRYIGPMGSTIDQYVFRVRLPGKPTRVGTTPELKVKHEGTGAPDVRLIELCPHGLAVLSRRAMGRTEERARPGFFRFTNVLAQPSRPPSEVNENGTGILADDGTYLGPAPLGLEDLFAYRSFAYDGAPGPGLLTIPSTYIGALSEGPDQVRRGAHNWQAPAGWSPSVPTFALEGRHDLQGHPLPTHTLAAIADVDVQPTSTPTDPTTVPGARLFNVRRVGPPPTPRPAACVAFYPDGSQLWQWDNATHVEPRHPMTSMSLETLVFDEVAAHPGLSNSGTHECLGSLIAGTPLF